MPWIIQHSLFICICAVLVSYICSYFVFCTKSQCLSKFVGQIQSHIILFSLSVFQESWTRTKYLYSFSTTVYPCILVFLIFLVFWICICICFFPISLSTKYVSISPISQLLRWLRLCLRRVEWTRWTFCHFHIISFSFSDYF